MSELDWIVCGWYTPDYEPWFEKLEQSLIEHGAPYSFRAAPKIAGGWARNTCRKAAFALEAIKRYPAKTVIFLDTDCTVTGDLGKLAALTCDVACRCDMSPRHSWKGKLRMQMLPLTGHLVLKPTAKTRQLIEAWAQISAAPPSGANDQETFMLAMGKVDDLNLLHIGKSAGGMIVHDCASAAAGVHKAAEVGCIERWTRSFARKKFATV